MKYFTALADATFAREAFKAAGLDFEAALSAKNTDVLKSALAAAKPAVDAEAVLASAKSENDELKTKLAALEKTKSEIEAGRAALATRHTSLVTSLGASGIVIADAAFNAEKPDDTAAALKSAIDLGIAKSARQMVARAGHPGVLDEIVAEPGSNKKEKSKEELSAERDTLTSAQLFRRDFAAQEKRRHERN